jgi:uncharacterized protein (DUF608 family)
MPLRVRSGFCALILLLTGLRCVAGQRSQEAAPVPAVDPKSGLVSSKRLAGGVPLGGIGTGFFQLMTDGVISRASLAGNGLLSTGDLSGCFAALWTRAGDRTTANVLALSSAYRLPAAAALRYDGLYPRATLDFPDPALPLKASLRAFSPIIPFDLADSSYPAAAFVFRLENTTPARIEVSAALSWENILGVGSTAKLGRFQNRTGNAIAPLPASAGFFGLKFTGPPPIRSSVPEDHLRDNVTGDMTLLAYAPRKEALVTTAGWNALDARPGWWDAFAQDGSVAGSAPIGEEGKAHPAGVVAVRLTLRPKEFLEIPFVVAWYMPRCYTLSGIDEGHYYQTLFSDSTRAARLLLTDWRSLFVLTEEWQQRLLFSNLPVWWARRLINAAAPLTTHTIYTRLGRFALLDSVGDAPSEKTTDAAATPGSFASPDRRLSASALLLAFFPTLSAQMLAQDIATLSSDGFFPAYPGYSEQGTLGSWQWIAGIIPIPNPQPPTPDPRYLVADTAAFVLQMAQYVLWTGDRVFLSGNYLPARRALNTLLQRLDDDGLPAPGKIALNSAAKEKGGEGAGEGIALSPATATLWLAALRAGQRLATEAGDRDFVQACDKAAGRAAEGITRRFWNGQFYAEPGSSGKNSVVEPGALCAADQIRGEWAADMMGLGPILPGEDIARALQNLQNRNDKAAGSPFGPLYRIRADGTVLPDDPKARDCLLPASLLAEAALCFRQRSPNEGLALLQRLDETRSNVQLSPWQSPSRFRADTGRTRTPDLASLAHAADWSLLYALSGFALDLAAGYLRLTPDPPGTWRSLSVPVLAPTFQGKMDFRPTARGGTLTFRLDRYIPLSAVPLSALIRKDSAAKNAVTTALILKSVRIPGPPPRPDGAADSGPPAAYVSLNLNPLGARLRPAGLGELLVTFDTPLTLAAGDRLEIDVH